MGLQVDVPGAGRRRDMVDGSRAFGIAYIDHAEALREHVPDIGVATMHHDLDAVGPTALVAPADKAQVVGVVGSREIGAHR